VARAPRVTSFRLKIIFFHLFLICARFFPFGAYGPPLRVLVQLLGPIFALFEIVLVVSRCHCRCFSSLFLVTSHFTRPPEPIMEPKSFTIFWKYALYLSEMFWIPLIRFHAHLRHHELYTECCTFLYRPVTHPYRTSTTRIVQKIL
jgi:hypothetical protein